MTARRAPWRQAGGIARRESRTRFGSLARCGGLALLLICTISRTDAQAQASAPQDVSQAAWLAGCWELRSAARVTHEQWMAPAGGAMLGMSRTTVRDTLREWEHLFLGPVAGGVAYVARPVRQTETAFAAVVLSDSLLLFENAAHDFPQRIIYRRRGVDSLVARIEGTRGGQLRGVDFPMRRIACPGG